MPKCMCGGQKTVWLSWFSPSIFRWVPGIELGSSGLCSKCFDLMSHLAYTGIRNS